jgi:hypothetical protein
LEPFYMTFPMQNLFLAEQEYEKDLERMREMYPRQVARIAEMVSDRCDELEFEGSRIYDENPDRMMMAREAQTLYEKIRKELGTADMGTRLTEPEVSENEANLQGESVTAEAERTVSRMEIFSLQPPAEWELLEKTDAGCGPDCGGQPAPPPPQFGPPRPPQPPQFAQPPRPPQSPQLPPPPQPRQEGMMEQPDDGDDWLGSVVGLLLANEIYRRRCRYRRSRRWW